MENENKKSKKGLAIAIIAIIIIAIAAGAAYYFLRPVSPKDLFIGQLNAAIDEANASNSKNAEKINTTITLSGNIETTDEEIAQIAGIINQGKLTLNVQADTNAKKMLIGADVDYQNEKFISAKAFYQNGDNNVYLFVQDLFDRYFKISTEGMQEDEEIPNVFGEVKDMETASKILKETISENLKEEYFSKEDVDGTTKNTMKITVAELRTVATNIITTLKNNQEFLNCFESSEKIVEGFEDALYEINDMEKDYDTATIEASLYTKGISKQAEKAEIKVSVPDEEPILVTINKVNENTFQFSTNVEGTSITLNMEVKNSDTTDLDSVDTANAVDFENMTQEEMMTFYTNLTKMKIYSFIAPLLGAE